MYVLRPRVSFRRNLQQGYPKIAQSSIIQSVHPHSIARASCCHVPLTEATLCLRAIVRGFFSVVSFELRQTTSSLKHGFCLKKKNASCSCLCLLQSGPWPPRLVEGRVLQPLAFESRGGKQQTGFSSRAREAELCQAFHDHMVRVARFLAPPLFSPQERGLGSLASLLVSLPSR